MSKAPWSVARAKAALSQVIHDAEAAPQIIENRGRPVAVVVSFSDYEHAVGKAGSGSLAGSRWQRFLAVSAKLREQGGAVIRLPRRQPRRDPFRPAR